MKWNEMKFAVLLPRVGECERVSIVFVGCVTVNNLFHRPTASCSLITYKFAYIIVDLDFLYASNFVVVAEL